VRAGLELVAAVGALKTHARLQSRVGIATGLVVVGDLIGSGEAQERGIVGETPNLAARLQGTAETNRVVIADGPHQTRSKYHGNCHWGYVRVVLPGAAAVWHSSMSATSECKQKKDFDKPLISLIMISMAMDLGRLLEDERACLRCLWWGKSQPVGG
jgi:hypothetical protein